MIEESADSWFNTYMCTSQHIFYIYQVGSESQGMAFDPELGERAMLVRNHTGDWGVCVAKWQPKSQGKRNNFQ